MSAPDLRAAFARPIRALALSLSIVLHLAVIFAAGRVQWFAADVPGPIALAHVVWLNELPRSVPPEPPPEPEPTPVTEPLQTGAVPPAPVEIETEIEPQAEGPEREPEPEPPPSEPPPRADAPEPASPPSPAEDSRPRRNYLAPGIDWDEERERAVAKALEQQAREQNYRTFSNDDLFEEPAPETPNPREELFSGSSGGQGSNRSVLRTGQSRSRFLNRVAEICNALTGGGIGLGLNGILLGTACTEPGPTADYFADLRPDYMNMLPVCAESAPAQGLGPAFDVDGNEISTIKCRLVEKDALTELAVVPP